MEEKKFPFWKPGTHPPKTDLTGRRFGYIVVLSWAGYRVYRSCQQALWEVKCDCGKTIKRSIPNNTREKKLSCGCRQTFERSKAIRDTLIGMKVGSKKVIKTFVVTREPRKRNLYCILKCQCGAKSKYQATQVLDLTAGRCEKCSMGIKIKRTDWEDIKELNKIYTQEQLAEMYNCTSHHISKILLKLRKAKNGKS